MLGSPHPSEWLPHGRRSQRQIEYQGHACDLIWPASRKPLPEFDPGLGLWQLRLGLPEGLGAV